MAELSKQVSLVTQLRQSGFSELACQFTQFVERQDKTGDELIVLSAALLSDAVSQGAVALNLSQVGAYGSELDAFLPETVADWIARLRQSHLVGEPDEMAPMILTASGQLYLYRYWHDEQQVKQLIQERLKPVAIVDEVALQQVFADWHSGSEGIDWQKVAVMMSLSRQLSVISGGPGTGKTTIVLRLLHLLLKQNNQMRIALAAPTGKAAARLQQAISAQKALPVEAQTLHRLLGITADNDKGRYHADRPLAVDVLIIDEASMIDISLMATVMKALPLGACLILLGDSDQLSSIESGAVLADLCREGAVFSDTFCQQVLAVTGMRLCPTLDSKQVMTDTVVMLQHSYRFDEISTIGQLSKAVKQGDDEGLIQTLLEHSEPIWTQQLDLATICDVVMPMYGNFFMAIKTRQSAEICLTLFEQSRVLCALKHGPQSVDSVNVWVERSLARQGWRTQHDFYHGRPIMVTRNDYRHGLFNGDTGLVLYDEQGQLFAYFLTEEGIRRLPLNRLPAHETAFAMTVHKSQGSEFDNVCVVLPEQPSPILGKALLYTAITRAKKQVSLIAPEQCLRQALFS
jgi:exodeoxyribonuclease V alpha subunit